MAITVTNKIRNPIDWKWMDIWKATTKKENGTATYVITPSENWEIPITNVINNDLNINNNEFLYWNDDDNKLKSRKIYKNDLPSDVIAPGESSEGKIWKVNSEGNAEWAYEKNWQIVKIDKRILGPETTTGNSSLDNLITPIHSNENSYSHRLFIRGYYKLEEGKEPEPFRTILNKTTIRSEQITSSNLEEDTP